MIIALPFVIWMAMWQELPPDRFAGLEQPWLHETGWMSLLNGKDLAGWHTRDNKPGAWFTAPTASWDRKTGGNLLHAPTGRGRVIINGRDGKTADLVTNRTFGDIELYIEWMIPAGSNSGVYLQGLYEIQIFDSYGKSKLGTIDAGSVYNRWIDEKPVGGSAPGVNASYPPGNWQAFHIWFRAPRFDKTGRKTENARFLKVVFNGKTAQENFEVDGPTRAHMDLPEAPLNPLMLQGDHGPVAFRNIWYRPLRLTAGQK